MVIYHESRPVVTFLGSMIAPPLLFVTAILADITAQATGADFSGWVQVLVNLGVAGYMLWWFSARMERRLTALEQAAWRADRIRLLALASDREATTPVREEAQRMVAEIDAQRTDP